MLKNIAHKSTNTVWHRGTVDRTAREKLNGHKSIVIWFTGLPVCGKSTIAHAVQDALYSMRCLTYVLDGDDVRHGICSDLGYSRSDRTENIRRSGEVVKLFLDAGILTIAAFISPFKKDREWVRTLVGKENFIEIFCDSSLEVCEKRDFKGHYQKARKGEISEFTGISSPYEILDKPDLHLKTDELTLEQCVCKIINHLLDKRIIAR